MFASYHFDPLILSNSCPSSNALVKFANRLGATIDPEFLYQCQISDETMQKKIDGLKSIPLVYETPLSVFEEQDDLFLDMDGPESTDYFSDPWQFRDYNAWADTADQWNSITGPTDDLHIEFL